MEFNPPFINVTYHRAEYIYRRNEDGGFRKVVTRKRPGTVGICAAIRNHYDVDAVPHLICGGFNKDATEDALIDLHFLGIDNVLVLRGDPLKSESRFTPEPDGHQYAVDLVHQVNAMNRGAYLEEDLKNPFSTNFCIGVAGYPEKHFEAPNLKTDLKFLKQKIDAGGEYIVTQMFFDVASYKNFVNACREEGINVPIIPGIKPLTRKSQITTIPRIFSVDIPEDLYDAMEKCKSSEDAQEVGIEWTIQQCKELIEFGAPCIHFYTMGKPSVIQRIAREIL